VVVNKFDFQSAQYGYGYGRGYGELEHYGYGAKQAAELQRVAKG